MLTLTASLAVAAFCHKILIPLFHSPQKPAEDLKFLLIKLSLNLPEAASKRCSLTLTGWCLTNDHTYLNNPAAKSYRFAEECFNIFSDSKTTWFKQVFLKTSLLRSSFLSKVAGWRPETLLKMSSFIGWIGCFPPT